MWKAPKRPRTDNGITQCYNDGIVTVYSVSNAAKAGYKPIKDLEKKIELRYEEQRLGIRRYYSGRQNQIQVERVIRVPKAGNINNQDIAQTEDGNRYRIDMVQTAQEAYPLSLDLTLAKIEQKFEDVSDEMV